MRNQQTRRSHEKYLHRHYDKATGALIREQVLDNPFPVFDPEIETTVEVTVKQMSRREFETFSDAFDAARETGATDIFLRVNLRSETMTVRGKRHGHQCFFAPSTA